MGKQSKQWDTFILGGSKITADGDCSHDIKIHLFLERKAMTKLDSELKSRDITLSTKVHLVKAIVFPVVIYHFLKMAYNWAFEKLRSWHPVPSLHGKQMRKSGNSDKFSFLGLQNTADCGCIQKTKRCLLLGRKTMTNLESVLRNKDFTFSDKDHIVKAMIFLVVIYECESWTIKKAECWRIDAFKLWCWRLLGVPWTARRSIQSALKEINPEYSLEGLMLKLKLQ